MRVAVLGAFEEEVGFFVVGADASVVRGGEVFVTNEDEDGSPTGGGDGFGDDVGGLLYGSGTEHFGGGVEEGDELGGGGVGASFGFGAAGDVADDGEVADGVSVVVLEGVDGAVDRSALVVGSDEFGFAAEEAVVGDVLDGLFVGDVGPAVETATLGEGGAEEVVGGPAVELFGGGVDGDDAGVGVLEDDGVGESLDERLVVFEVPLGDEFASLRFEGGVVRTLGDEVDKESDERDGGDADGKSEHFDPEDVTLLD